jgi:hypothetical protein
MQPSNSPNDATPHKDALSLVACQLAGSTRAVIATEFNWPECATCGNDAAVHVGLTEKLWDETTPLRVLLSTYPGN